MQRFYRRKMRQGSCEEAVQKAMLVESSGREKPGEPIIKNPMKVLQSQNKIKRRHSVHSVTSRASPHFSAPPNHRPGRNSESRYRLGRHDRKIQEVLLARPLQQISTSPVNRLCPDCAVLSSLALIDPYLHPPGRSIFNRQKQTRC